MIASKLLGEVREHEKIIRGEERGGEGGERMLKVYNSQSAIKTDD